MSVQVSYKKQTVFFILLILIILSVLEVILRIYEDVTPECKFVGKDALNKLDLKLQKQMCDDHLSLKYEKIGKANFLQPNQHMATVNINSMGFRGDEITEKGLKDIRILVLGASTIYGDGASSDDATIPAYIQKNFDKETNLQVQVINGGIGGLDSNGEILLLNQTLNEIKPDLVIVYDGWADIINVEFHKAGNVGFAQESLKYYKTPKILYKLYLTDFYLPKFAFDPSSQDNIAENWKNNWMNICKNNERNFKIIVFVQPLLFTGKESLSKDEESYLKQSPFIAHQIYGIAKIGEKLKELDGICDKTVDLRNIFNNVTEPVFIDYGHMNDFGNEIIAQKIFEEILPIVINDL